MEGTPLQHPLSTPLDLAQSLGLPPMSGLPEPFRLPAASGLPLAPLLPLLSSMAFWLAASLAVGLLANHLPGTWLEKSWRAHESPRPSRVVQRLVSPAPRAPGPPGIRVWKRWIPDAGGTLPGGVRKASLVRRDPESLRRLVLETRRAELVHWLLLPGGLLTALWLPPLAVAVNVLFALAFNLPCLLLQRWNRARLLRCIGCRGR